MQQHPEIDPNQQLGQELHEVARQTLDDPS